MTSSNPLPLDQASDPPSPGSGSPPASPTRSLPVWRFWLPLALQLALILPIPLRNAYTVLVGETMILQTLPVDPYDILRGYSQTLTYEVSNIDTIAQLPGGEFLKGNQRSDRPFYLIFSQPETADSSTPVDWKPQRVSQTRPPVQDNERFIKAYSEGYTLRYNLERFYMPESQRNEINTTIGQLQQQDPKALKAEIKVDRFGEAVLVALWIDGDRYAF